MAENLNTLPDLTNSGLSRTTKITLTIILLLLLALSFFLLFPINALAAPAWLVIMQTQWRQFVTLLTPYGVVGLMGGIVALAELASTFQTYPREALRTRWAQILVLVNMSAAILALIIAQATMPETDMILLIIGVGVGFQAIIRTRFILAKQIGGDGDGEVSVNVGWLYDQFQNLCRNQIDLELMNKRRTAVTLLLSNYPALAELYDIAWYTVIARATLSPEEEKAKLDKLQTLLDPKAPEQFARTSIALMILENGGQGYVDLLLSQSQTDDMTTSLATAVPNPEHLVRQLVGNYTLDGLVELCNQLSGPQEVTDWVNEAAKPDPNTNEANQKAAIAHFMVQQLGVEMIWGAIKPEAG